MQLTIKMSRSISTYTISFGSPFVMPEQWKQVVAKEDREFTPRMIFKDERGNWVWSANCNYNINISNWKLNWKKDGKELLMTMKEFNKECKKK